jgi:hypothetical protein
MLLLCALQMKALSEEQYRTQGKLLFILTAHHSDTVIGRSYATPISPKPNNQPTDQPMFQTSTVTWPATPENLT